MFAPSPSPTFRLLTHPQLETVDVAGGPLTSEGLLAALERFERRQRVLQQVKVIAETDYFDLVERFVESIFERVKPPPTGTHPHD